MVKNNILKIFDKNTFSKKILSLIKENPDDTCMEIIIDYAEKNSIEYDMIPSLLSPRIKDILYKESIDRNVFKPKTKSLEIEEDED